jgi:hypothetical protein
MLPALEPKNPTEALLLGHFLALNDSGMECLRLANLSDQRFHCVEKYFTLAHKLLNMANQTMQTILKYRSGGQQTVQVVHVHNEGQLLLPKIYPLQLSRVIRKNLKLNPMDHYESMYSKKQKIWKTVPKMGSPWKNDLSYAWRNFKRTETKAGKERSRKAAFRHGILNKQKLITEK